jgi:hypothetical protein
VSPVTHFFVSWAFAEAASKNIRDRRLIVFSGVAPDIDGLGALVDSISPLIGGPHTTFYTNYHHILLHGLPGAMLIAVIAALTGKERLRCAIAVFAAIHLHLFCDMLGSRGPMPDDIWQIHYLAPISMKMTMAWSGQWRLDSWQNFLITLIFLSLAFVRAVRFGQSPVMIFSEQADQAVADVLRNRWQQLTSDKEKE